MFAKQLQETSETRLLSSAPRLTTPKDLLSCNNCFLSAFLVSYYPSLLKCQFSAIQSYNKQLIKPSNCTQQGNI